MLKLIQYDLFEEKPDEVEELRIQLEHVAKSSDKVRRGTYASINELKKVVMEMREDLDFIKKHLCRKES